jgi:phosphate transport system permease protein
MGLAVGLLMVGYLLWLIVSQGVAVFWPDPVAQISIKPELAGAEGTRIAGEIAKKQVRVAHKEGETEADRTEWQLFLGNRDLYGYSFKYINTTQISGVEYPPDIMVMERVEYGDAIGYAVAVEGREGRMNADDPKFAATLAEGVAAANRRRAEIQKIEKRAIGENSEQIQKVTLTRTAAERSGDAAKAADAATRLGELQAEYQALAAKAQALREDQAKQTFIYRLAGGEERTMPVGGLVHYYFPNQLGFTGKVQLFFHNLWVFISEEPREANTEGGIFPAIFGTFVMTLMMSVAVTPFGVVAAIYLREYAKQGLFVRSVRIAVNNLAGVPSIVFGVFGLGFFVYFVGGTIDQVFFRDQLPTPTFGTGGILWASLTLALMTVPVVIVATEEALAAVPRGAREASLACGASKWQTIQNVVLPASSSGILTGLILAMARGAGEVAPLMLVGVVKLAPTLPLDTSFPFFHLDRKFMHLGFHIYDLGFQSPDSEAAKPMVFATTLFLILLVVLLNLSAIIIRERLRRKYATGAF